MKRLPKTRSLSISQASAYLGVVEKTLRRWEERGLLQPFRTDGGHRRYDIDQIRSIKARKGKGRIYGKSLISADERFALPAEMFSDYIEAVASYQPQIGLTDKYKTGLATTEKKVVSSVKSVPIGKTRLRYRQFLTTAIVIIGLVFIVLEFPTISTKLPRQTSPQLMLKSALPKVRFISDFIDEGRKLLSDKVSQKTIEKTGRPQKKGAVLAAATLEGVRFLVNVPSLFSETARFLADIAVDQNASVGGNLNLAGNADVEGNLALAGTATIDGDVTLASDLSVAGVTTVETLSINDDEFTDLTGTGLQVSNGTLQTTLGTSIESGEITDDTIKEVDLNASNSPTNAYVLTYNSSTSGFTWAADQSGGGSLWTDGGTITYLTSTSDDLALGGSTSSAPFFFDVSANDLYINGVSLDATGTGPTNSGASLIGVFGEFTNSSETTVQGVLDDLDSAIGAGGSKWTDSGTVTYLTNTTDDLVVGATTPSSNGAKITFDGDEDEIQLEVRGFSTQTSNLILVEQDGGADVLTLSNDGNLAVEGQISDITDATVTVNDSLAVSGDLAVNGAVAADITSTTTAATVFDSTVTSLSIGSAATTLNIADAAITGTIDIGGVTADGVTTVNIATNGTTNADTIAIGNVNTGTTLTLTGGDAWNIASNGVLTLSTDATSTSAIVATDTGYTNALDLGDNNITGTAYSVLATGGALTLDASTSVALDGDTSITLSDGGTLYGTLTQSGTADFQIDAAGNNVIIADGDVLDVYGTTIGLNNDADAENVLGLAAAGGSAGSDLYWGDDLLCDMDAANCGWATSASSPFTQSGADPNEIIDKSDLTARLRLQYGDAADTQLTIENTTNNVIPTTDSFVIDLTGNTTGIVTDGVDAAYIALEAGDGTTNTVSGIRVNLDTIAGSGDETFVGIDIDALNAATSASEYALRIGDTWDANIFFNDATTSLQVASGGNITFEDPSGNDLLSLTDAGAIVIGSSAVGTTTITLATDGTGDAEVALPTNSISGTEILDDTLDFADFQDTLDLDATTTINGDNDVSQFALNFVSDLTVGDRSVDLVSITQADDATFSLSGAGNLFSVTNSDTTGGTVVEFDTAGSGTALAIDGISSGTGISFGVFTSGTAISMPSAVVATSGSAISIGGSSDNNSDFVGDFILLNPSRTVTSGTITDTGNFLDIARSNTLNAGTSLAVSGDLVSFASSGTETTNGITDSSNILSLAQNCTATSTDCTGSVLELTNFGTGNGADLLLTNTSGTQTNGLYIYRNGTGGTTTNAINIAQNAGTLSNGINFSAGTIGTGITFDAADLTTEIVLENADTISNQVDGIIALGADSGAITLSLAGTAATISNTAGDITVNAFDNNVLISDPVNVGGGTAAVYNFFSTSLTGAGFATDDANDVFVQDELEVEGTLIVDGATDINLGTTESVAIDAALSDQTGGIVDVTATSDTGDVEAIDLAFTVADDNDDTTETLSALHLLATQNSDDATNDDNLYGLLIDNLGGTAAGANEYAIYQAGTAWDRGALFADSVQLGENGADGQLILYNDAASGGDWTNTFNMSDSQAASIIYTLPPDDGADDNYVLTTNGSGVLNWEAVSGAGGVSGSGTDKQIAFFNGPSSVGSETAGFGWDYDTNRLTVTGLTTETTGNLATLSSTANTITSGGLLSASLTQAAATGTSVTSDIGNLSFSPIYSTAVTTPTISGNVLDLSRSSTTNTDFTSTLTVSGAVLAVSDSSTQTTGTLTNTANILALTQNYAAASGAIIEITNAGTGADISLDNDATITNTTDNNIALAENSLTLNLDFSEVASTIQLETASDFDIDASADGEDALELNASAGGINILASGASAGEDIDITATGSSINLTATEGVEDNITLTSTNGGINITATGAAADEDIDISTNASINLTSTEGVATGLVLTSTNGGIDLTTTGAAAGEDIDITSSASLNLTGQEAAVDAIVIDSATDASGVRIIAGDNEATALADGNDIEFLAEDDAIFSLTAAGQLRVDAATNVDSTVAGATAGTVQLAIDAGQAATSQNNGIFLDYEILNDANADQTFIAQSIILTPTEDAAGDTIYGLSIDNASTAGTAADRLISLDNSDADTAVGTALHIESAGGGINYGIDLDSATINTADIRFENSGTLAEAAAGTWTFDRATAGTVTLVATDDDADTALTINSSGTGTLTLDPTGAGAIILGSIDVTDIDFITDNGDAADISFTGGATFNDEVTLTLAATEALTVNNTTQGAADLVAFNPTWAADNSADALAITTTYNVSASTSTVYGLNLTNADNGADTGVIDALALFSNNQATETLADGVIIQHNASSGTLTDALQIANTTAGGTIANAINILETAGTITTGLNLGAGIGTAISLQDGETIDNSVADTIVLASNASGGAGVLRLPVKTDTGDPTPALDVEGNIYYNTFDNVFRCYQASGWTNCIGAGGTTTLKQAYDNDADGSDVIILTTSTDGDIIFQTIGGAADTQFEVTAASAPEIDMVNFTNTGFGTVTANVDTLTSSIFTATGTGANNSAIHAIIGNAPVDASDVINGVEITGFAQTVASTTQNLLFIDAAASGNTNGSLNGINIDSITADSATEYAINFGTGWDANLNFSGAGDINIVDNSTTALTISQGSDNYLVLNTDDTNTAVTLDLPVVGSSSTTGNLFTSNVTKTINIGTGTAADTINIGTGATTADTINFGNTTATLATTLNFQSGAQTVNPFDFLADSVTTANAIDLSIDALTTGEGLYLSSTSTALASGGHLALFEWNPGSADTTDADLFTINVNSNATVTGDLFHVQSNSSDLFSVGQAQITSALPHQFTATGDVSIAYDLVFTNQTASQIESYGPFSIVAGESFENNNLTLSAYGTGNIILDPANAGYVQLEGATRFNAQVTLANDATPDVSSGSWFVTGGTTTITDFDAGSGTLEDGHIIVIESAHAVTIDCAASTEFYCGTTDIVLADNDLITFVYDAAEDIWRLVGWVDESTDGGQDIAEFFQSTQSLLPGEVVKVDPENPDHVIKSASAYESSVLGTVSTSPGITLGENINGTSYPIALAGQVPVKISQSSANIIPGDYLTTSTDPGMAMKATQAGQVLGRALEGWTPGSGQTEIMMFVNLSWHDSDVFLTDTGDITIASVNGDYQISKAGAPIDRVGLFSEAAVADLTVGTVAIQEGQVGMLTTDRLGIGVAAPATTSGKLVDTASGAYLSSGGSWTDASSRTLKENFAKVDADVVLDQINQLTIKEWNYISEADSIRHIGPFAEDFKATFGLGADDKHLSALDTAGVALVGIQGLTQKLGGLALEFSNLETNVGDLAELVSQPHPETAQSLTDLITRLESGEQRTTKLEERTTSLESQVGNIASTSAQLVSEIDNLREEMKLLTDDVELLHTASSSAQPRASTDADSYTQAVLALLDGDETATFSGLLVTGKTVLNDLGVTGTATFGLTVVDGINGEIKTLGDTPLKLQTNALAGVELVNGLVTIDPNGNVKVLGNLAVSGDIEVGGNLTTGQLTLAVPKEAATSKPLPALTQPVLETTATAGTASVPAGKKEITIINPKITETSLIYVTPTTSTRNQVLYVKEQTGCEEEVVDCQAQATIGFDAPVSVAVEFNWWVVQLTQQASR